MTAFHITKNGVGCGNNPQKKRKLFPYLVTTVWEGMKGPLLDQGPTWNQQNDNDHV
jgi:hypothetical protein